MRLMTMLLGIALLSSPALFARKVPVFKKTDGKDAKAAKAAKSAKSAEANKATTKSVKEGSAKK